MSSYIHSRWKNAPPDSPVEFFSEMDHSRWETRKVEVFTGGRLGYASKAKPSNGSTRLAIIPLPPLKEIASQIEFEVKEISADQFEIIWKRASS